MLVLTIILICVFLAVGSITYYVSCHAIKRLNERSVEKADSDETKDIWTYLDKLVEEKTYVQKTMIELQKAGLKLRFSEYMMSYAYILLIAGLIAYICTHNIMITAGACLLSLTIPLIVVKRRQSFRLKMIDKQLPDVLMLMANGLKAGYSFMQGMELIATDGPSPIKEEFNRVVREVNLGYPIDTSLDDLVARVGSEDLDLAIVVIKIQRQVGGNLAEILEKIVHTIRERIRVKGEINTLTAQGKMQGWILSLLIPGVASFMYILNPEFMTPLFHTTIGMLIVVVATIMHLTGVAIISKIVRIDV